MRHMKSPTSETGLYQTYWFLINIEKFLYRADESLHGARGKKISRGPLWRHNCKTGEAVFYNILHFIAYYPALTQLGFIFSVKQSCIKKI